VAALSGESGVVAARRLNREDLRISVVQPSALALLVIGAIIWWRLLPSRAPDIAIFGYVPVFMAGALACCLLGARFPLGASAGLLAFVLYGVCVSLLIFGIGEAGYLLLLLVLLCGVLLAPWASLACALVLILLVYLTAGSGGPPWLLIASLVGAGPLIYLALRPLHYLLGWAWRRSTEAAYLAEALRDRQGELNRTVTALDLTNRLLQRSNHELALARQEAEDARRLKEDFAASISHELRTPLNIVLGFTEIMHQSPHVYGLSKWPATLRRDITEVYRSARYLSDMIDDVLDLARVEAGRMPVRREPTDLAEVIGEAVEVARALLRDRPVALLIRLASDLPNMMIDRARIRQVLLNLLTNASRYTQRGEIVVSAEWKGEEVVVAVDDSGVGIAPGQLEIIFDEFRQAGTWRSAESEGKGLGLAIAKRFVQLHGGSIWAESELGKGSTLSFSLPVGRKDFSRLRQTEPSALPPNPYPPCLVLLDCHDNARAYLKRHLEGYEVLQARSREEAIGMCQQRHPQAILLNTSFPHEAEDAVALAESLPWVPLLRASLPTAPLPAQAECFSALLPKPVSAADLVAAVRSAPVAGPIMVVDDDRGFVQFAVRALQATEEHYEIAWAYSAREALQKMRRQRPAVLILDIMMPEVSGLALLEAVQADAGLASVRTIAVTGMTLDEEATQAGGRRFILERRRGLRERELLGLIRSSLELVRADYVSSAAPRAQPETAP